MSTLTYIDPPVLNFWVFKSEVCLSLGASTAKAAGGRRPSLVPPYEEPAPWSRC